MTKQRVNMAVKCPNCGKKPFSFFNIIYIGTRYNFWLDLLGFSYIRQCFHCKAHLCLSTKPYVLYGFMISVIIYLGGIILLSGLFSLEGFTGIFLVIGIVFFIIMVISASLLLHYFTPLIVIDENKPLFFSETEMPENALLSSTNEWLTKLPREHCHVMNDRVSLKRPEGMSVTFRYYGLIIRLTQKDEKIIGFDFTSFDKIGSAYYSITKISSALDLSSPDIETLLVSNVFEFLIKHKTLLQDKFSEQNFPLLEQQILAHR